MCSGDRVCCYLLGSIHIAKLPENLLECASSRVSYVLIEGFKVFVLPDFPDVIVYLALLPEFSIYTALVLLFTRLKRHRLDMEGAETYFKRRGIPVEVADLDIKTVLKELDSVIKITIVLIVALPSVLVAFTAKNSSIIAFSLVISFASSFITFLKYSMIIRDRVVVEKTIELCREHVVLIIRGRNHIPFIKKELSERGVKCIELSKVCSEEVD